VIYGLTWNVVINRKKVFSSDDKELAEMVLNSIKNEDAKCYTITQKDDYPIYYPIYKRLMKIAEIAKSEISEDLLSQFFQGLPKMPGDSKKYQYTPSQTPPQRVIKNILKHSKSKNLRRPKQSGNSEGKLLKIPLLYLVNVNYATILYSLLTVLFIIYIQMKDFRLGPYALSALSGLTELLARKKA
jgi:hypothetical protein